MDGFDAGRNIQNEICLISNFEPEKRRRKETGEFLDPFHFVLLKFVAFPILCNYKRLKSFYNSA